MNIRLVGVIAASLLALPTMAENFRPRVDVVPFGCLDCFNFVAPSVLGAQNIAAPQVGLIVYDASYNSFRAYNSANRWVKLSNNLSVRSASTNTSVTELDDVVEFNANSGPLAANLLDATIAPGKVLTLKKTDNTGNYIAVNAAPGQAIDGVSGVPLFNFLDTIKVVSDGSNWVNVSTGRAPSVWTLPGGSGTFYPLVGAKYIIVELVGGGGGGGGTGSSSSTAGATGGNTTFGSLTAAGGGGGQSGQFGGAGGQGGGVAGPCTDTNSGSWGASAGIGNGTAAGTGGHGGTSVYQGAGAGGYAGSQYSAGNNGASNSGSGGGGASGAYSGGAEFGGGGGGSAGFCRSYITTLASSYSYSVGSGGAGGSGSGSSNASGGTGGSGYIKVIIYFQ
jgi:hypothetical protein